MDDEIRSFISIIKDGPKFSHEFKFFGTDSSILLPVALFPFTGNCFLHVLFGERFAREDQGELFRAAENGLVFQRNGDDYGLLLGIVPWLRHIFPEKSRYRPLQRVNKELYAFIKVIEWM